MKKGLTLTTLCLAIAGTGHIATVHAAPANGFQVGIDGGQAEVRGACDNIADCDSADTSFRGNIGYQFTPFVSAELGYTSFGTTFDTHDNLGSASQEAGAITASVVGTIPIGEKFGLFGRVGAARYDLDNSGTVQGVPVQDGDNSTKPYFGAGAKFHVTDNFALRAEYQVYRDLAGVNGNDDDLHSWSGGVQFTF